MKKNYLVASLIATASICATSCNDDTTDGIIGDNTGNELSVTNSGKCWSLLDANFLTNEDVILSDNASHVEVSKVLLKHIFNDDNVKKGDVLAIYIGGDLNYLKVNSIKDNGALYYSIDTENIDLEKTLEICNINMGNVRLSSELYMDPSQPKRVNNSGAADPNGIINTQCYVEQDGETTVYHPMSVTVPAHYEGMNADDPASIIPGEYVGCYVGQVEGVDANGIGSWLKRGLEKIGNAIISPVKKVVSTMKGAIEFLEVAATGGSFGTKVDIASFDYSFEDKTIELNGNIIDNGGDDDDDDKKKEPWTKEEMEASVNGKCEITLNGRVQAGANAYINMDFSPCNLKNFRTGVKANTDVDLDITAKLGVEASAGKPISLAKFDPRYMTFMLGPVPIRIAVYPEIIWKSEIKANVSAYADFNVKYKKSYDAYVRFYPDFKAGIDKVTGDENGVTLNRFGIEGSAEAKTGIYVRTSWLIYSVTGPVFDFGAAVKASAQGEVFMREDHEWQAKGSVKAEVLIGDADLSYSIKFPPLKDKCEWLYNKLTWESGSMLNIPPLYTKTIFERDANTEFKKAFHEAALEIAKKYNDIDALYFYNNYPDRVKDLEAYFNGKMKKNYPDEYNEVKEKYDL